MSIRVVCPSCDQVYTLDDSLQGRKIQCRDCKGIIAVPAPQRRPRDNDRAASDERLSSSRSPRSAERSRRAEDDEPRRRPAERSRDRERHDEPRITDRRPARSRRGDADARGRTNQPAILIGACAGGVLVLALVVGGLVYAFSGKRGSQATAASNAQPTAPAENVGGPAAPAPAAGGEAPISDGPLPVEMAANAVQRVKQSTVFLRVNIPGGTAEGSGFFAIERGIVITNAHVLGMLKAGSQVPRNVTVVVNSGESSETRLTAAVLGVDQSNDLAVLRVQGDESSLPAPLPVDSATKLTETQKVYIFGFPFGSSLGKNITVSTSAVSSLRRSNGVLKEVQVNGGMHPGNSGGPVTDSRGVVVGVSVAGITGTTINFAIPADFIRPVVERTKGNSGLAPPPSGPLAGGDGPPVGLPPAGPFGPGMPMGPRRPGGSRRPGGPRMPSGPTGPARGSSLQADLVVLRGTWESGEVNADDGSGTGTVKLHIGPRAGIVGGRVHVDITTNSGGRKTTSRLSYNFSLTERDGKRILVATSLSRRMTTGLVFQYNFEGERLVISGKAVLLTRGYNLSNVSLERISKTPADMPGDDPTKGDDPPAPGGDSSTAPPAGGAGSPAAIKFTGEVFSFIQTAQAENRLTDVDIRGFKLGKTDKDKYRDLRVEGGVLIGFQLGLGKFFNNVVVKSWRPIYLTKSGEKLGKWYGKASAAPVTLKAKYGYVVSGISIRTSLGVDGLSLTFAKLGKNGLDLNDTYQSSHVGGDGGNAATIGGKGELFVGVSGYLSPDRSPCALGLVAVLP